MAKRKSKSIIISIALVIFTAITVSSSTASPYPQTDAEDHLLLSSSLLLRGEYGIMLSGAYNVSDDGIIRFADDQSEVAQAQPYGSRKSPTKAFFMSAVVPGTGQFYAKTKRGILYMIAEAAFWSGYFILHGRAEDLKEDYIAFVDKHILFEADSPAKSTKKWTLEDYEHATQTDNWHYVYTESNGQPIDRVGKFYWSDLPKDLIDEPGSGLVSGLRAEAYSKRGSMNEKFKQAKLCIGLIIVNHVISAIDGRISAISFNNRLPENSEISIKPIISPSGNLYACLTLEKHF